MAAESKPKKDDKAKSGDKAKPSQKASKDDKKAKKAVDEAAAVAAAAPAKKAEPAPPRPPADPRLKVLKKFRGRFLPKGPLRDRLKALLQRWDSGEDHGGVTVEELKSLHADWVASRQKPTKAAR